MAKIPVTIICKNEAKRIRRTLQSVSWADEIVVLDSGSDDGTLDIAREFTDSIYVNTDWPGFGLQKRLAADKARNDWILSLDADEVVSDELRDSILELMRAPDEATVYRANRLTCFCGRYIRHSGWHPDRIVRLYHRGRYQYSEKLVHETVSCDGAPRVDLAGKLYHYTYQSLEEYIDKRNGYARAWADSQYRKGKRAGVFSLVTHSLFAFVRHYILMLGFLDGYHGFLIAVIQMQYTFNKYNFLRYRDASGDCSS